MTTKFTPLIPPTIDPRNEQQLVELALDHVFVKSGGQINDFSAHSPVRALIEGQAFVGAELQYYLNQALDAFAIRFLQIAGIQRKLGSPAVALVRFELTGIQYNTYVIPAGFVVYAGNSKVAFTVDNNVILEAGQIYSDGLVTCTDIGTIGNVPAYAINQVSQPLSFLARCYNIDPAMGGTDEETEEQVYIRAFQSLRRRGLISTSDYENEMVSVLGSGSLCRAIANLDQDGITYRPSTIHLFGLNPDRSVLTDAQKQSIQDYFATKTLVTTDVFVSSIHLYDIGIIVIARLLPGVNPAVVAENIRIELDNYLAPGNLPLGESIKVNEIEYHARLADGVSYIETCQTYAPASYGSVYYPNTSVPATINIALPYPYSTTSLRMLDIRFSDGKNNYRYIYGEGDPD